MPKLDSWDSVNTSLAVTKNSLDAPFVCEVLGFSKLPKGGRGVVNSGSDWWAYTYVDGFTGSLEEQLISLVNEIKPLLDRLDILLKAGYSIQVAIAGSVETGSQLFVSPRALGQLASLGIPISFTTLTASGVQEEDPLGWLDG
ncbi:hypothetical protein [Streptomyces sp. NPDC088400]|uniref:hypothetical protein n=1 Tax=Streptomyces sp. NPDC088400 TaxID=3365861 RepID=UPI00381B9A96